LAVKCCLKSLFSAGLVALSNTTSQAKNGFFVFMRFSREKLNIRFKFNDSISEERSDEVLFRVFDILLSSQRAEKGLKSDKKSNENNRNTNIANKG